MPTGVYLRTDAVRARARETALRIGSGKRLTDEGRARALTVRQGKPKRPDRYPSVGGGKTSAQYVHRARAEKALGRALPLLAQVHHVDGSKSPDAPLVICEDQAYHALLHVRTRVLRAGGDPNTQRICGACGRLRLFGDFNRARANKASGIQRRCRDCSNGLTDKGRAIAVGLAKT